MPTQPLYLFNVMVRANKRLNSKYGQYDERQGCNERRRRRRTGDGSIMRGDTTTSQGGQEANTTENLRATTRSGGAKKGGGVVGREVLAQHQQMIWGGSGQ